MLLHGAFADASSWGGVIVELQSAGISVLAPPNPLRRLDGDAAYIAERVRQIDSPVLLAGHSYGGAVITIAAAAAHNVVGLVYVAAFIPDVGERLAEIGAPFPQSRLDEVVRQNTFPLDGASETAVELSIAPEKYPPSSFPAHRRRAPRRPPSRNGRSPPPPSLRRQSVGCGLEDVALSGHHPYGDESIHPDSQRFMADRAGAHAIEVPGPHMVMLSEPARVADHIRGAMRALH